ncbi:aminoacyl-tRNA deacylase [Methylophilus aquaticus]|uniref:YbaK/EbsC family protein n=1 Tax=Methylophilus aquaticus TaxID=1971610 RepID=A0ABT9JW33_9PROT|nr:YbaK/EbsC family protein [Methylophilus aquaticus]MDP8568724.1 YbaK/EbsC family protein [Methylophilus aquaticus]
MQAQITSPVTELLSQYGYQFQIIPIPLSEDQKPIRSLEALLQANGLDPASVVRSVVFKGENTGFCLLAVAGAGRADWAKLRAHLGERKCRMAEYDEVPEATGYVVGAVPPIALPDTLTVLVDNSVKAYDRVVIGSGVLGYAIALKGQDLMQLLASATAGDFVKVEA